jgi:hypothetical protein
MPDLRRVRRADRAVQALKAAAFQQPFRHWAQGTRTHFKARLELELDLLLVVGRLAELAEWGLASDLILLPAPGMSVENLRVSRTS